MVDVKISYPGELRRADARLFEELFFPAQYQLTGAVPEEKPPRTIRGGSFYRKVPAGILPCFRRGLALQKGSATSLSGCSSACIRIRLPGLPAPGNTIPGVLRDPIAAGLRHLRAGFPLVSRCVRRCCIRMLRGIPPYLDAQVDRQVRPDLPGAAQQRFPAVLVELQQYLVALQSPYEEVRCIPVYREPAPSCVAVGECRFERIVGAYGPQAERRAGFYALFWPPAQAEAPSASSISGVA